MMDHRCGITDARLPGMACCSLCGSLLAGDARLCAHHELAGRGWALENRIMCDLLHRGIAPPRVPLTERSEDVVLRADAA
jgi:hypothetical protein